MRSDKIYSSNNVLLKNFYLFFKFIFSNRSSFEGDAFLFFDVHSTLLKPDVFSWCIGMRIAGIFLFDDDDCK